ncbi:glycoprotein C [Athtab bunya-like virus]|uniref:glycoprotein C n=1 Tax=Athtab bunya-like virus TaxID=2315724 RepID=UPI000F0CBF10|nr:glycoprotein C [Athtab bunya-like virus]AYK39331.1 glycoprotein C [Athtab bunya-like virus]
MLKTVFLLLTSTTLLVDNAVVMTSMGGRYRLCFGSFCYYSEFAAYKEQFEAQAAFQCAHLLANIVAIDTTTSTCSVYKPRACFAQVEQGEGPYLVPFDYTILQSTNFIPAHLGCITYTSSQNTFAYKTCSTPSALKDPSVVVPITTTTTTFSFTVYKDYTCEAVLSPTWTTTVWTDTKIVITSTIVTNLITSITVVNCTITNTHLSIQGYTLTTTELLLTTALAKPAVTNITSVTFTTTQLNIVNHVLTTTSVLFTETTYTITEYHHTVTHADEYKTLEPVLDRKTCNLLGMHFCDKCLPPNKICNGIKDCADGTDEPSNC